MIIKIDFGQPKSKIRYDIMNSNKNINIKNDDELFEYFELLIKYRHNVLHYAVLESMKYEWLEEKTVSASLNIDNDDNDLLKKTPDIVLKYDNNVFIIDVSLSIDLHLNEYNKKQKYAPLVTYLNTKYNYNSVFIHINVSSSLNNLEQEINKITTLLKDEFDFYFVNDCTEMIEDKKEWVSNYIDKKFFDEQKQKKYNNTDVMFENRGIYSDLDIKHDDFVLFNKKYNLLDKIVDPINNFKEDDFINLIKNELDNKSEIYQKYRDNILTDDQFKNAYENIIKDNKKRKIQQPKPTHHIIIPKYEVIEELIILEKQKYPEQTMIENIFNYIIKNNNEIGENIIQDSKYLFLLTFIKKYLCYKDDQPNNNVYCSILNTGTVIVDNVDLKQQFNCYKTACEFILVYEKNNNKDKKDQNMVNHFIKKLSMKNKTKIIWGLNKNNIDNCYVDMKNFLLVNPLKITDYKPNLSFRDYLMACGVIKDNNLKHYPFKQKTISIAFSDTDQNFIEQWKKTSIGFFKNKPTIRKWDVNDTIEFDKYQCVDDMITHLSSDLIIGNNNLDDDDFFLQTLGEDSFDSVVMKQEMIEQYKYAYLNFKNSNCYHYLKTSHYLSGQLLHFSLLNLKPHTFSVFNAGVPNAFYIVAGCYNQLFSESGKPFMFFCITKTPDYYSSFFGKLKKIPINSKYTLIISNWRRLPTTKLTFMKDSFYSVLSSTMNSFLSTTNSNAILIPGKYRTIFSVRTIISLCTNQKIAELLMDNRYAYMSAFSIYTNINKLLIEKFGPPYRCDLETWIVNRILKKLPQIFNAATKTNKITLLKPEFLEGKRSLNSIGGEIEIPSLWGNYKLLDIAEVMDEAFIYVHTMKEPSNIFHEEIKAIQTIINFQKQFDNLPDYIKYGSFSNNEDVKNYLLYDTKIGSCAPVIYYSTKHTMSLEKPNIHKYVDQINSEPISELISTKAVISDVDRFLKKEDYKETKKNIAKYFDKYKKFKQKEGEQLTENELNDISNLSKYYLHTKSSHYDVHKPRQKVFETVLDVLIDKVNIEKTIDLANEYITNQFKRMIADICIKSQYGSKREFYVINIGAKALARCTENFFKKISTNSPNEAISIPGDEKVLYMQKMLEKIYYNIPNDDDYELCYVNGDCTKWSAAETLSSFIAMIYGMQENLPPNMFQLLLATFNVWSDKDIQVPTDVYNKVIVPNKLNKLIVNETIYALDDPNVRKTGKFHSTQNFLQGMFNYSSSYKAVCCTNYTLYIWKKIYPTSKLILEHMEHSDDYVNVVLYTDRDDFEKFRVLHKIMMRLHGYNDSDRKTNCQFIFMEFVSQMSFNGVMLYPQIKKSKEVNTCLPCVGYKQDMEFALSRVSECMRVGCNQSFLYFFEKLHIYCVAEAYSILPKMHNNCDRTLVELFNTPIEMFGLPDLLPLFSLYCRGNGNNYRIFNYGKIENRLKILSLYELALLHKDEEKFLHEDNDYAYSLFNPKFMYDNTSKNIIKLRKSLNINPDEIVNFWKEHISYRFVKPVDKKLLILWIKSMFFNRSFVEAYLKSSRTKMTMRLSSFVKNKVLKTNIDIIDFFKRPTNMLTIRETIDYMNNHYQSNYNKLNLKLLVDDKVYKTNIIKIISKCDPTYSAIYSILNSLKINIKSYTPKHRIQQVAVKTPTKIRSIDIMNSPNIIIQYLFNKSDFIADKRKCKSMYSLTKDIDNIKLRIPEAFIENQNTMNVLSIFNDLMISKEKPIVMMGYNRLSRQLTSSIIDILRNNLIPHVICDVHVHDVIKVVDPFTNNLLYLRGQKLTPDLYQQILENICLLYVYLFTKLKYTVSKIRKLFDELTFYTNDETTPIIKVRELSRKFSSTYFEQYNIDMNTRKIAAYLFAIIYGDQTLLYNLIETVYNYSYKYIEKSPFQNDQYIGDTIINFSHMKTTQRIYQFKNYLKTPLLVYHNNIDRKMVKLHYNITLRLLGMLSEDDFVLTMYYDRIPTVFLPFKGRTEALNFFKKNNITYILKREENNYIEIPAVEYNEYQTYVPVLLTKYPLVKFNEIKGQLVKIYPQIKNNKLGVYVGNEKIYTLPFWKCKQYNNLVNSNIIIDHFKINDLFKYNLLSDYINGTLKYNDLLENEISMETELEEFIFYLAENRIYDVNIDNIIDCFESKYGRLNKEFYNIFLKKEKEIIGDKPTHYIDKFQIIDVDRSKEEKFFPPTDDIINLLDPFDNDDILDNTDITDKKIEEPGESIRKPNISILDSLISSFKISNDDIIMESPEHDLNDQVDIVENDNIIGLLDEDENAYTYEKPMPDVGKDILNTITRNFTITDLFVEKPFKQRKYKNKDYFLKQNYCVNKLKHLPPLSILYTLTKYCDPYTYKTNNIANYINTLFFNMRLFNNLPNIDNENKNIVYSQLYYFFCNIYLTKTPIDNHWFEITNKSYNFMTRGEYKDTNINRNKINNSKKCTEISFENGKIFFNLTLSLDKFLEKYQDTNNLEIIVFIKPKYQRIIIELIKDDNYYDDLL
jgi:hypothetical protein